MLVRILARRQSSLLRAMTANIELAQALRPLSWASLINSVIGIGKFMIPVIGDRIGSQNWCSENP